MGLKSFLAAEADVEITAASKRRRRRRGTAGSSRGRGRATNSSGRRRTSRYTRSSGSCTFRCFTQGPHLSIKLADDVARRIVTACNKVSTIARASSTPDLSSRLPHDSCKVASRAGKATTRSPLALLGHP